MNLETPIGDLNISAQAHHLVYIATSIYGGVCLMGLVTVSLFVAVLIKGHSTFKEFPFFTIVWQLTISNLMHVVIQAFCIFPLLFFDLSDGSPLGTWYNIGTQVVSFTDTAATLFILLIALNRFAVFIARPLLPAFNQMNIKYPILVTWLLVVGITVVKSFFGPTKKFSKTNWEITDLFVRGSSPLYIFTTWLDFGVPIAVLSMYILIYVVLRSKRSALDINTDNRTDHNLLTQGMAIALSLTVFRMLANLAPAIKTLTWVSWLLNIFRSISSICNHTLNPILFLTTNKTVRVTLSHLLHCRSGALVIVSDSESGRAPKVSRISSFKWLAKIRPSVFTHQAEDQIDPSKVNPTVVPVE